MIVTVHSCTDQLHSFHGDKYFGLNDVGYDRAMEWLNKNQEYRGGERYEYFGIDVEIEFMWEMTQEKLRHLLFNKEWNPDDYCGSLFFGDYKIEFIWDENIQYRINCFEYNPANGGSGYGFINGIPFDQCIEIESEFVLPKRRSIKKFTQAVEEEIVKILNKHPDLIESAILPTDPDIWYTDKTVNPTINMIH